MLNFLNKPQSYKATTLLSVRSGYLYLAPTPALGWEYTNKACLRRLQIPFFRVNDKKTCLLATIKLSINTLVQDVSYGNISMYL